ILCSLKARAKNPTGTRIDELFATPPDRERHWFPVRSLPNRLLLAAERVARLTEPLIPKFIRRRALKKAEAWFTARLNGTGGLGAIFPAMVNAYEALRVLGYGPDHPSSVQARDALRGLLVDRGQWASCQPCFSTVWDTAIACLALLEAETAQRGARDRSPAAPI